MCAFCRGIARAATALGAGARRCAATTGVASGSVSISVIADVSASVPTRLSLHRHSPNLRTMLIAKTRHPSNR
ncbi:MAG TPA: hypothetical protein VH022_05900 [Candidatus Acidoferrum sp.]|nr:hypothetical protein [Candidatus Acidoferrum sp.]